MACRGETCCTSKIKILKYQPTGYAYEDYRTPFFKATLKVLLTLKQGESGTVGRMSLWDSQSTLNRKVPGLNLTDKFGRPLGSNPLISLLVTFRLTWIKCRD